MVARLSFIKATGLLLLLFTPNIHPVFGLSLTSQLANVLRVEDSNDHHRVKRYPVESARVVITPCPIKCYRQLVRAIGPVSIKGLVEIQIEAPPSRFKPNYNYTTAWEAFERTCWTYRWFTTRCLQECDTSVDKTWLQEVFFSILHNYCVVDFDSLVYYWPCYHQLAEQGGGACERSCSTSCSVDCTTECYRPLAKSLCGTDQPIDVLVGVVKRVLPKIVKSMLANGERLACEQEISHFLRAK